MDIFKKYLLHRRIPVGRTMHVCFFLTSCLFLITCRKNEFTRPEYLYIPNSNPEEISIFTSTRNSAHIFLADIFYSSVDSSKLPTRSVAAYFSDSITSAFNPSFGTTVDSVKFNGAHLKFNRYYYLMDSLDPTAATIWQASLNPFSSFTYNYPQALGNCPEFYSIPDTFHQTIAYVKYMVSTTNLDSGAVFLTDGYHSYSSPFDKANKRLLVSLAMMQHFPVNKQIELLLICTNNFPTMYRNKHVCISSNHIYRKKIYLLP